jgi:polysaccharide biosynthesis/export protein
MDGAPLMIQDSFRIALLSVATLAAAAGCSGTSVVPAERLTQSNAHVEADYRIGPGDKLRIFVWRNEDLSAEVVVRPDGKMSMPLVDDMQAEGKTPTDLAADLERTLGDYVRSPKVNVIVESFVGTFGDQIRVVGQAINPRPVSYRARMTILDVMLEVGGLTDHASGNRAKVMRQVGSKQQGIAVRLNDLLYEGDLKQNIEMLPGDVVVIPTAIF